MSLFLNLTTSSVFILILLNTKASALTKIVIDPGHGGVDTGAQVGTTQESELALQVALLLKTKLDREPGIEVHLTREKNQNLSLQERVHKAEALKADLFVSLHANSSPDSRAKGVQFYFQNQLPADEETLYLAHAENRIENKLAEKDSGKDELKKETDVQAIVEDLKRQVRIERSLDLSKSLQKHWDPLIKKSQSPIRQAPFFVVTNTSLPSVLVELGFLTNPQEAKLLTNKQTQVQMASRIHAGLLEYLGRQSTKFPLN